MRKQQKLLTIYPQTTQGNDSYIIGSTEGLRSLRTAIDKALEQGQSGSLVESCDGANYQIVVIARDDGISWRQLRLQYAMSTATKGTHPFDLLTTEQYLQTLEDE